MAFPTYQIFRSQLTEAYKSFDQEELQAYKRLTDESSKKAKEQGQFIRPQPQHSNYLDSGKECDAYKLEDGKHCAKVYVESSNSKRIRDKLQAMHKAKKNGCDQSLSKITAVDVNQKILIQELAKGKAPTQLSENDFSKITKQQFLDLMNNLDKLFRINVEVDLSDGNILYDDKEGFSLIDFDYNKDLDPISKEEIVKNLRDELLEVLKINTNKHSEDLESKFEEASQDFLKAN